MPEFFNYLLTGILVLIFLAMNGLVLYGLYSIYWPMFKSWRKLRRRSKYIGHRRSQRPTKSLPVIWKERITWLADDEIELISINPAAERWHIGQRWEIENQEGAWQVTKIWRANKKTGIILRECE